MTSVSSPLLTIVSFRTSLAILLLPLRQFPYPVHELSHPAPLNSRHPKHRRRPLLYAPASARTSRLRLHRCIPFEPASRACLQGSAPVSSALLRRQPAPAQRTPPAITASDAAARPVILGSFEKAPEDGIVKAEKYGGVRWSFAGMQVIVLPRALALI